MNSRTHNTERSTPNAQRPVAPEYERAIPDRRTPLVEGGEVAGVFVDAASAAATRRFLERFPKQGGAR